MTRGATLAILACTIVACRSSERPARPPRPIGACTPHQVSTQRFPVGASPTYRVGRLLGEGTACTVHFVPNEVLASTPDEGSRDLRIIAEGWFSATCNAHVIDDFEGVEAARLAIVVTSSRAGLAKFELDSHRPDATTGLAIDVFDRCDNRLSTGLGYDARWSMGPGCETVVRGVGDDGAPSPRGFETPRNAVTLAPIASGSCELTVEAYGVRERATITVR